MYSILSVKTIYGTIVIGLIVLAGFAPHMTINLAKEIPILVVGYLKTFLRSLDPVEQSIPARMTSFAVDQLLKVIGLAEAILERTDRILLCTTDTAKDGGVYTANDGVYTVLQRSIWTMLEWVVQFHAFVEHLDIPILAQGVVLQCHYFLDKADFAVRMANSTQSLAQRVLITFFGNPLALRLIALFYVIPIAAILGIVLTVVRRIIQILILLCRGLTRAAPNGPAN